MTISFFLSSNKEFLLDEQWEPHPVCLGYYLDKYILTNFRGEWYPPGMDGDSLIPNDVWNLMQLSYYVMPADKTSKKSFQQYLGLFGNRLSPSKMLAQRYDVFTSLQSLYTKAQVDVNVYLGKSTGFSVQAPDWMSACTVEGFLLAALNSRPKFCSKHIRFYSSACLDCEKRKSLQTWLRQLKCREKIDEQEKKACLRQADTFSPDFAMRELRERLIKEGKLRGYKNKRR